MRGFIQELLEQELTAALGRTRHERAAGKPAGYRNGTRKRRLLGSFGPVELSVPRARMVTKEGATQEWRSSSLPRYARMTAYSGDLERPIRVHPHFWCQYLSVTQG